MSLSAAIRYYRVRERERASSGSVAPTVLTDFLTGGSATFARACSVEGDVIEIVHREDGEPHVAFVERAKALTAALGAPRLVVGGLDPAFDPDAIPIRSDPPRGTIALPVTRGDKALHPGQRGARRASSSTIRGRCCAPAGAGARAYS